MASYSRGESFGGSAQSGEAAASSKLYPMSDLIGPDWRSREQLEPSPPSTSPAYWDTDEDDDSNSSCVAGPKPTDLYGKFTWKIENFSEISKRELRSNVFEVGGYKWYILVYPQGCDVCNHLSLFLCVADYDKLLPGWSHFAQFTIAVVNKDPKKSKYSVSEMDKPGAASNLTVEQKRPKVRSSGVKMNQMRRMVKEFSLWGVSDDTEAPIGVSPALYAAERIILNGGHPLEFSNPLLYPARIYGKGNIPDVVKSTLQVVHTTALIRGGGGGHEDFPASLYCIRMQLRKHSENHDLERRLEDERFRGHRFLYHGLSSWGYVLPILIDGFASFVSLRNEFGRGVYLTDNLALARDYVGIRHGAILIFDWTDEKGLSEKTLVGEDWENTVKGWICMDGGVKPAPPRHREDMLIGFITNNYNAISHCSKPEPSQYQQFVARTERAFSALNRSLFAIIYLE